jgi:hypothetical protein
MSTLAYRPAGLDRHCCAESAVDPALASIDLPAQAHLMAGRSATADRSAYFRSYRRRGDDGSVRTNKRDASTALSMGIESMSDERLRAVAAAGLAVGAMLGIAGSFAPSAELRGLAWGVDGVALVVGSALLVVHHLRHGDEQLAAGFLVFLAGETLIVSGSAMELAASAPLFAAGAGLWSAALALVSASRAIPGWLRVTGAIAAILFAVTAARIFGGAGLTPLSEPLPFYAYPFLAVTLLGWAWAHMRPTSRRVASVP